MDSAQSFFFQTRQEVNNLTLEEGSSCSGLTVTVSLFAQLIYFFRRPLLNLMDPARSFFFGQTGQDTRTRGCTHGDQLHHWTKLRSHLFTVRLVWSLIDPTVPSSLTGRPWPSFSLVTLAASLLSCRLASSLKSRVPVSLPGRSPRWLNGHRSQIRA